MSRPRSSTTSSTATTRSSACCRACAGARRDSGVPHRWISVLGLLAFVATAAAAQGVVVDKSDISFVTKQMGANVEGRFRKWKANVVFKPQALASSKAEFDIDLASIDFASEEFEAEVRGAAWFDTAKFPVARFASTSIKDLG